MTLATKGAAVDVDGQAIDLDWAFWSKQREALEALRSGDYDVVVFRGGYGSGKSILGSRWIHQTALSVPKSDNLVLAQDSAKGGPTTYKVFFEQLPGEDTVPDEGGDPENSPIVRDYNRNKSRITYVTGAVARLGSADKWNRYAGGEFNAIWADEVAHYENTDLYRLNKMLISRQRTEQGPNQTLWTSTGNGYNQFYDFVERQVDADDEPLTTRIKNVLADSRNNPHLNEKEKLTRQFEGTESEAQGLAGGFAAAEGRVYDQFTRNTHVVSRADVTVRDGWRMYGYDYGWDDPRVIIEYGKTPAEQYVALDCYYRQGKPVEDAIAWLRDNDKPRGPIYCDHDPEHIDKFRQAGWDALAATKDLDEGINEVQDVLDVDGGIGPGLLVVDDLTNLIQEFQSYKEDDVGTSRADDHCLDVTRYAVMGDRYVEDDQQDGFIISQ